MGQFDQLREANRENFHRIWQAAKEGRALSAEEKRFADTMGAHPEYHNAWEFSDVVGPVNYEVEGVNPFLHIAAHVMIEAQLEKNDPPEAAQALERLRTNGIDRHQAIHHIASEMFEVMFPVLKEGKAFDIQRYRKRLRRLGR
ncbi:MAG: DUF1841 family protein [Candidatus Methylomirabilales bacterium]